MDSSTTHAVILAAGAGTRLGGVCKGLLMRRGNSLVARAVATCLDAGIYDTHVVIGAQSERVRPLIERMPSVRIIDHPDWAQGRTSSLQAGLRDLPPGGLVLIFPVDVALIGSQVIVALLEAAQEAGSVVATRWTPVCNGHRGHPILITSDLIPELLELAPDADPKPVFRSASDIPVPVDDPMIMDGIKTPEDVARWGLKMPDD